MHVALIRFYHGAWQGAVDSFVIGMSAASARKEEGVTRGRVQRAATVGVAEHGNSAVLVTLAPGGELLDRRRIDLTDRGLPAHPHHHEGSWAVGRYRNSPWARTISLAEAVALVERVRASAARGAREGLDALAAAVPVPIESIAIRVCPKLPPTTAGQTQACGSSGAFGHRAPHAAADRRITRGWSGALKNVAAQPQAVSLRRTAPRDTAGKVRLQPLS